MYRIGKEEIDAVARVINSKELFKVNNAGRETENCEAELREKLGAQHVILMTSGKAALISALTAMGIGPGDEVIVPAYTYIATAIAVTAVGAIPVITEVDESLTLDVESVEKNITKNTKVILPVHIQGFPSNMDAICALAKKYNLKVLEDACQADGGSYKGKRLGTIGDTGAFSFNQYKIITSGEGGAFITNYKEYFERALIYHDSSAVAFFGNQLEGVDENLFCGVEYRTNDITAAILREQLKKLDPLLADLRKNKKYVMDRISKNYKFIKSNDINGDCGTTIAITFEEIDEAKGFAEHFNYVRPIDTGKHVYKHWTPILRHNGAYNDKMNPYKMEANAKLNANYSEDMCPKTLELLSKTVYIMVNPDWTTEEMDKLVKQCNEYKEGK